MLAPDETILVIIITGLGCASLPALTSILKSFSGLGRESAHQSEDHFEDSDGSASKKALEAYEKALHPWALLAVAIVGSAVSLATTVVTIHKGVAGDSVNWIPFATWLLTLLQCIGFAVEKDQSRRFVLSAWLAATAICLLVEDLVFIRPKTSVIELACTVVRLGLALLVLWFSAKIPRRPMLRVDVCVVDDQYTVPLIQRLWFSWVSSLLKKARQRSVTSLEMHDLPILHQAARASYLRDRFSSLTADLSLWRRIFYAHRHEILGHYVMAVLHSIAQLASQWVMYRLLKALESRIGVDSSDRLAFALVLTLGFSIVFAAWLETQILWVVNTRLVICLRSELTTMLYAKVLTKKNIVTMPDRKRPEGLDGCSNDGKTKSVEGVKGDIDKSAKITEDVMNLVALDTKRITDLMSASFLIPGSLSKLTMSMIFLVKLIGWRSVLAGFIALLLLNPLNIYCSRLMNKAQIDLMRIRDNKMSTISEVLRNIRQIKFTAMETEWLGRINTERNQELRVLWYTFVLRTALVAFWQIGPILFSTVSLALYSRLSGSLQPSIAFTTIAIFGQIEGSLAILPKLILQAYQASVSFHRIQNFINMPDHEPYVNDELDGSGIKLNGASFAWPGSTRPEEGGRNFLLKDLTCLLPVGRLSVICGDTGSGKSLLLSALAGQAECLRGKCSLPVCRDRALAQPWTTDPGDKAVAYASQDVWIENATIKENILFDLPLAKERYQETIFACGLSQDLATWPDADETEVGVGGVNLSGGQKWRLSLARALYSRANVLLIDDVFSALDAHVGRHVWTYALKGPLVRGRTCVVATHHLDLCSAGADAVIRLQKGEVIEVTASVQENEEVARSPMRLEATTTHNVERSQSLDEDVLDSEEVAGLADKTDDSTASLQSLREVKKARKFVTEELRESGAVKRATYACYASATGGILMAIFVLSAHLGYTISGFSRTWWLSVWTRYSERNIHVDESFFLTQQLHEVGMKSIWRVGQSSHGSSTDMVFYLWVYLALSILVGIVGIIKFLSVLIGSIKASQRLFDQFSSAIVHAPMNWLDRVPTGRIMNRFTADFDTIDNSMADGIGFFLTMCFQLFAIVIAGMVVSPYIILAAAFLSGVSVLVARMYLPAARDVKRLDSLARSPIMDRFQSTSVGLDTIRAYSKGFVYLDKMMKEVDDYSRTSFYRSLVNLWLMLRLNFIGAVFTTIVAGVIVMRRDIDASLAGFALSFALQYTVAIEWAIRQFSATQLAMNSTERILEYSSMQTESVTGESVPAAWPPQGRIEINNLRIGYNADEDILKGVSMQIEPGTRVGIVGRTGAGKSTLSLALFRFLEASSGSIDIDGVDIAGISLRDLRSRLAIIPQDPILFTGDVRANLDPLEMHSDDELCNALENVHFSSHEGGADGGTLAQLAISVGQGGANLSQGQKQLLCMARSLVARQKILVMDEATSSVDMETDARIQKSIREAFQGCTLIVIAHRLSTLADFDQIFVLDDGKVVEKGSPRDLWQSGGAFTRLVQESGERLSLQRRFEGALSR